MFKQLGMFGVLAVCLFTLAMGDCGNKPTKPIDPPIVTEDPIRIVSVDPPDGSTIMPGSTVTVTFDGTPEEVQVSRSLGSGTVELDASINGNTVTIVVPPDPGKTVWVLRWSEHSSTSLVWTVAAPPPTPPKKKTFKEQLEGEWSITKGPLSIQDVTDELEQAGWDVWFLAEGLGKDLQFESSGKVVLIYLARYFAAVPPGGGLDAIGLVLTYTLKGSYEIADDAGNSATMTLSLTDLELDVWSDDGWPNVNWNLPKNLIDGGPFANLLGDVLNKERVEINGDELRLGEIIAERAD